MLFKKNRHQTDTKWRLIGLAGKVLIDSIFCLSTIDIIGEAPIRELIQGRQHIFAFWHSRILLLSYFFKGYNASIMVSNSADGEIIAQILQRQGQHCVRGSTHKGGMRALNQLIRNLQAGQGPAVVIPDGPQGPRHQVQPGVLLLAKKTGMPIIPLTYSTAHRKVFNSWDRFILPRPAGRCVLWYGRPVSVSPDADVKQFDACGRQLRTELNRITALADARFGHRFTP